MKLRINIDVDKYPHSIRRFSPGLIIVSLPRSFEILREFGFNSNYEHNGHHYVIKYEDHYYRAEVAANAGTGMDIRFVEHIEGM